MKRRIYKEEQCRLVKSNHGEKGSNIHYRVFKGTVRWPNSDADKPAIVVLMQYGGAEDWREAVVAKKINFRSPAHMLAEDLPNILKAVNELQDMTN